MQQETSDNQKGYRRLIVWQKADKLALQVYLDSRTFPREELFGLVSQMRRAAVSTPANIVEGYSRSGKREKIQFYNIAKGSLTELEYYVDLALNLGYLNKEQYESLIGTRDEVGRLLNGLIKSTKL